jgi:hypothetical protein
MSFTFGASAGQKPAFGFGSTTPSFGAPAATTATTGFGAAPAPSFGFGAPAATYSAAPAFGFGSAPAATAGITYLDFQLNCDNFVALFFIMNLEVFRQVISFTYFDKPQDSATRRITNYTLFSNVSKPFLFAEPLTFLVFDGTLNKYAYCTINFVFNDNRLVTTAL